MHFVFQLQSHASASVPLILPTMLHALLHKMRFAAAMQVRLASRYLDWHVDRATRVRRAKLASSLPVCSQQNLELRASALRKVLGTPSLWPCGEASALEHRQVSTSTQPQADRGMHAPRAWVLCLYPWAYVHV